MTRLAVSFTLALVALAAVVSAQPNVCVQLGGPLISICRAELDEVEKIYPLNSETPITDEQVAEILSVANSLNLPSDRCCQQAARFAQERCPCDESLPPLLARVGFEVTSVGLQSADKFTSQACNFEPVVC
ncbi:hypothetical protein Ndes2526B_g04828 [Nannochloris sp. 'desiccata']